MNDGGPAFPFFVIDGKETAKYRGLSMRDYFAAKALQGFLACPTCMDGHSILAPICYEWADAMLKAREDEP